MALASPCDRPARRVKTCGDQQQISTFGTPNLLVNPTAGRMYPYIEPTYISYRTYEAICPMDVKTLCLGVLSRGDATGYEIKKQCEEGPFAYFYAAGFGSIYPALSALKNENLISVKEVTQDGKPSKKVYSITVDGRHSFLEALEHPPAPDRLRSDFLFMMFFGQLLPAREVDNLIAQRLDVLHQRLGAMEECRHPDMPGGEAFSLGYAMTIYKAAADYLDSHRHELVGAALRNEIPGIASGPSTEKVKV
jgi:PadR family transcriptional regulator AphA